eukprot:2829755-Rhodomonas_salina.2
MLGRVRKAATTRHVSLTLPSLRLSSIVSTLSSTHESALVLVSPMRAGPSARASSWKVSASMSFQSRAREVMDPDVAPRKASAPVLPILLCSSLRSRRVWQPPITAAMLVAPPSPI